MTAQMTRNRRDTLIILLLAALVVALGIGCDHPTLAVSRPVSDETTPPLHVERRRNGTNG